MREDTKLWGPRVFQRGMGATLLSHGNGEDKTGDSWWLLFAASIRGVDVSWQAVGKSMQPPNVTSLPACLAHGLPLPAGCLAGREAALLVCPGAVRVGSGFGCWVLFHKQGHEARPLSRGPVLAAGLCGGERGWCSPLTHPGGPGLFLVLATAWGVLTPPVPSFPAF